MPRGSEQGRPRLTPAIADVRRAVRESLADLDAGSLVLVALSGGPDSLALAAATAFEAPRAGLRAGAIVVDHGLQAGSDAVAQHASDQAGALGLAPVITRRVSIPAGPSSATGGTEAAARDARYRAIDEALLETGARAVLLGHTLDDQAETVLLGLARGAGASSLSGMARLTASESGDRIRPLLGIRRATTLAFCADSGLVPWHDPHNTDTSYTRVRVRTRVLPVLESELGPGIAEALARTASHLREDAEVLDAFAREWAEDMVEPAPGGIAIRVSALEPNPDAIAGRIVRHVVASEFGVALSSVHTREVLRLVRAWKGQRGVDLPGVRVSRTAGLLLFVGAGETEGP